MIYLLPPCAKGGDDFLVRGGTIRMVRVGLVTLLLIALYKLGDYTKPNIPLRNLECAETFSLFSRLGSSY